MIDIIQTAWPIILGYILINMLLLSVFIASINSGDDEPQPPKAPPALPANQKADTWPGWPKEGTCNYPKCSCPLDAPADPDWCAIGLSKGNA